MSEKLLVNSPIENKNFPTEIINSEISMGKKKKAEKKFEKRVFYDQTLQENVPIFEDEDEEYVDKVESEKKSFNIFYYIYDPLWKYAKTDEKNILESLKGIDHLFIKKEKGKFLSGSFLKMMYNMRNDKTLKKKHDIFKIIVYYSGHGGLLTKEGYYKNFPAFKNAKGHRINTKELFDKLVDLKLPKRKKEAFNLVVFVADMCSTMPSIPKEEKEVEFQIPKKCETNYFEFQGSYYIRTSQRGTPSRGNEIIGSYFLFAFTKMWTGDYADLIDDANNVLGKYQVASRIGSIVGDYDYDEDEMDVEFDYKTILNERKRKRDEDEEEDDDDEEQPSKKKRKTK